jgi:Lipocalin-like domain
VRCCLILAGILRSSGFESDCGDDAIGFLQHFARVVPSIAIVVSPTVPTKVPILLHCVPALGLRPEQSEVRMRALKAAIVSLVLITGFSAALAQSAPPERAAAAKPTKQVIIGAWRLVGIDYAGPNGSLTDPVFGPNPQGVIIYDQSGWMSVQIVTANRPAMARPATRTSRVVAPEDAKLAAAAFDTYYAYFGTWDYNAETSIITHHLNSSLLPYETGLEYRREVTFDGEYLKLIARSQERGEERVRTLVWTRVADPVLIVAPAAAPPAAALVTSPTAGSAALLAHTEPPPRTSVSESGAPPPREVTMKYGDMPIHYKEAIIKYFLEHLKYPDSLQYEVITKPEQGYTTAVTGAILMSEKREYGWTVTATVNAKNSHNSYVGFRTYTFLFRGEKIVDARLPLHGDELN